MEDINLIPEPKWFYIGKRKYNVARINSKRMLKAQASYNSKIKGVYDSEAEDYKNYDSEYDLIIELLDSVLILFRINFKLTNAYEWLRRIIITKDHILKTIDGKNIMDFIEDALDPILGAKKKEMKRQAKMIDAMMILVDKMTPEVLAELLQNSLQTADTKLNIS